jgi:hypothetical protein
MSAKQGGSFATLLLVIPLAAIPLMAIFGIPEFTHLSASEDASALGIVRRPPEDSQSSALEYQDRAADLFVRRDVEQDSGTMPNGGISPAQPGLISRTRQTRDDFSVAAAEHSEHVSSMRNAFLTEPRRPSPRPMPTSALEPAVGDALSGQLLGATESGLTWREASRRLQEIGISEYRLERGHRADRFLFVCRFSPGSNPRVVQRFEAESSEPLAAVEDVLTQVETWLQYQYVESRRWVR